MKVLVDSRQFWRTSLYVVVCLIVASAGVKSVSAGDATRPNVIVILTDDQGTLDLNCYGATDLATPHLDRLAKSGIRFTQFYAASAVCSPSRAGLLTGLSPQAAGVPGNVGLTAEGMPSDRITMAEVFKEAGYRTAHIGKWHLGNHESTVPNGQGFDYSFGHHVGCIDNYSHFFYWSGPNKHDLFRNNVEVHYPGQFFPDLMVKEATQFMEKKSDDPFFMYFAINVPHYPYQGDEKWLNHYRDSPHPRNLYAAFVSTMDERLGMLFTAVEELHLTENTVIVFQSDHGHSTEVRAFNGGGYAGPYRGAKFSLHEGGLRVPAIISWPGRIAANEVRDTMAVSCDWLPTLAELCGLPGLKHKVDGKSLVPVLTSASRQSAHESFCWELGGQWVVREGNWKLCFNVVDTTTGKRVKTPGLQLFNLASDPGESNNLAEAHPDIVGRLKDRYQRWQVRR